MRLSDKQRSVVLALATVLAFGWSAQAEDSADWPQWRGPQRDGKSTDTGLLESWPEGGPPLAWRASGLGGGYSTVAVAGGRIYTMGDLEKGQHVIALSAKDGSPLWKTHVGPKWEDKYLGSRSTPAVDGDRVYALNTEGVLVCLATETGKLIWSRDLPKEFGGKMMSYKGTYNWKFSESPLIDGDRVVISPGADKAAMVALNKLTGEEIWRTAIPKLGEKGEDGAGYASIVIGSGGGVRQYVQLVGRGAIGVATETGRLLWSYNRIANPTANIPTPLVQGNHVFVSTGYGTGAALLRLAKDGEGVKMEEVYFLEADTMQNHHGGMILHEGYVYTGTAHNKGFPLAVKLETGEVAWGPVRNKGTGSAAIAYADGRLYFRYQDGLMVLAEATPKEYRELGSFMIPDVEQFSWAHPVITGGKLYLREQDNLFCYNLRK